LRRGYLSHRLEGSPPERKAAYEGLVAPYLLEIDRELAGSVV
jgi:hypothetical protein